MARLDDLGEKAIVSRILESLESGVAVGPGDDAAAIDMGSFYLVVSTDLVSKVSHSPSGMTDWQIGWMAAAVNYSDIAAMGAEPLGLLLAMGLPREMDADRAMVMIQGANDCSRKMGASLLGGDTKEASEIILTGTALGKVEKEGLLTRSGAVPGDLLAVTGELGQAAAGFISIMEKIDCPRGIRALMEPWPRIVEGRSLSRSGHVTACIDISDGLAHSVHLLSGASGVAFELEWESIPMGRDVAEMAEISGVGLEELVLFFGGDYELLFTISPDGLEDLRREIPGIRVIGRAVDGRENILSRQGEIVNLENRGWEHFA